MCWRMSARVSKCCACACGIVGVGVCARRARGARAAGCVRAHTRFQIAIGGRGVRGGGGDAGERVRWEADPSGSYAVCSC